MAVSIKFEWISDGFREILMGAGTEALVMETAQGIADRANAAVDDPASGGFEAHTFQGGYGGGRVIGSVSATDRAASIAESEHHALSSAMR